MSLTRARSAPDRLPRRGRDRDLAVRPARPADPARGRRDGPQAAADRRRARRELRRLHALRGVAARQARPAAGLPAQPRDRAALPGGGDAARAAARARDRAAVRAALALPRRGGGFLLGVSLGLVFVPCAGPVLAAVTASRRTTRSAARDPAHDRLRARRRGADGADRLRRPRGLGAPARARRAAARRIGRRDRRSSRSRSPSTSTRASRPRCPGYTQAFQDRVEQQLEPHSASSRSCAAAGQRVATAHDAGSTAGLPDYGVAPAFASRAATGSTRGR